MNVSSVFELVHAKPQLFGAMVNREAQRLPCLASYSMERDPPSSTHNCIDPPSTRRPTTNSSEVKFIFGDLERRFGWKFF
jgi:hypothetical protein